MKIEFRNVTFAYVDDETVLHDLSFTIEPGQMVAILGHNGSGKSTIAKLAMGILEPNAGDIYIDDMMMNDDNMEKVRARMGIIFQNPDNQFVGVTVKDDIAFGLENHQIEHTKMVELIDQYATLVGMEQYLDANPEKLSGGQKQRVAIAGVMAMETELIIFDESTSMLDPQGTKEINKMIKMVKDQKNKTIITITHHLEEAVYADRIIVLQNGHIVLDGKPQAVLQEKAILEQSGLVLIDSIDIIHQLKNRNMKQKEQMVEALWELTFKM